MLHWTEKSAIFALYKRDNYNQSYNIIMFKPKNSLTREKFTWGGVKPYESPSCAVTDIVVSGPLCQSILANPEVILGTDLDMGFGIDL